jgi:hypothetical protein
MQNASWQQCCHSNSRTFSHHRSFRYLYWSCNKNLEIIGVPLVFFSCKLTDTESRYSTFDRELLTAQAAIKHFCNFCEGHSFQLWTDHKPLVTALSHVSVPISPRQQRHLAFISEFSVQLLCLPGLKNVVSDFLSCPLLESTETVAATAADPVDFEEMAAEQNHCTETQCLLIGSSLKLALRQTGAQCLAGDVSAGVFRPIVPLRFRKDIFSHFHNVSHPSRLCLPSYYFIQVCLARIVQRQHRLDRECLACQRGKIHCHTCAAQNYIAYILNRLPLLCMNVYANTVHICKAES